MSVIVEGHNEPLVYDTVSALDGLRRQRFPLDQVEVILVGSREQVEFWGNRYGGATPFFGFRIVVADCAGYFELKNRGAAIASGRILAFLDLDVSPEPNWLECVASAIQNDADMIAGTSLFRSEGGRAPDDPLMQVAASISWGNIVSGAGLAARPAEARGFHAHSVAFRASVFRAHRYREGLEGRCAGDFLIRSLLASGIRIRLVPEMRVAHSFTWRWWTLILHRRYGYETFLLRRMDPSRPHSWLRHAALVEPILTMVWRTMLDLPQWLRYSRVIGMSAARRYALLPLVITLSCLARGCEAIGMYQGLLAPERMRRLAAEH